ncbi:LidE [Legionella lansingensis]|uniref:LidE n=1 Tax=Legionella lansingensis TaxID=45067 RepID=A0A0W0VJD7_9GAMM|nr:hypothetical protein [Legionella lansingensis]KTD20213.1 LidE [Legionella lansingensis]SNV48324.1 LidE [Legionella lansingensis]
MEEKDDTDKLDSGITNRNTLFSRESPASKDLNSMASSVDRVKDFDVSKQSAWLKYSDEIIQEFCELLPSFPGKKPHVREDIRCPEEVFTSQLGCAYAFLASKRRQVAKELKQGPLRHQFGLFNKAGFASTDDFNLNKDIPTQKEAIYEQLSSLISHANPLVDVEKRVNTEAEKSFIYTIKIKRSAHEMQRLHNKNLATKSPFIEDENILTITFHDYGKDDARTAIVIDHSPTPFAENYASQSSYFQVQFALIEPYFQACLNWESHQGLKKFLVNAGKLAHSLALLQPVGRGNSAIVEWMIRGIARTKGIELGPFNHSEKIGWDFKAFLTPEMQDYANWFSEKAFVNCTLQEVSSPSKPGAY